MLYFLCEEEYQKTAQCSMLLIESYLSDFDLVLLLKLKVSVHLHIAFEAKSLLHPS